jgi:uncharacterized membrane protein
VSTGPARRAPGWRALAALLAVAGTTHFVRPGVYRPLIPPALGDPDPWVLWSGVAELTCAAALVPERTRRPAALAAAALFVAVYPGNVQQAVDAHRRRSPRAARVATLVRLPMQVPLVWWALTIARREPPAGGPGARRGSRRPCASRRRTA